MIARRRGSIVAFSSGLAHQGWSHASAYAATKGALIAFVKSAAKEVAQHRVKVNLIAPGVIDTPQYRAANQGADHERWKNSIGVGTADRRRRSADVPPVRCRIHDSLGVVARLRLFRARTREHDSKSLNVNMKPVLIAGAGPVGLTTALGLGFYGLPFQLFEEDAGLSSDTKAGTILTRTLEAFRRYGVADQVLAKALRVDEIGDVERATKTARPSVRADLLADETRYPFVVNMPQHHLEPILHRALNETHPGLRASAAQAHGLPNAPTMAWSRPSTPRRAARGRRLVSARLRRRTQLHPQRSSAFRSRANRSTC